MKDAERIAELEAALRRSELLVDQLQAQLNLGRKKVQAAPAGERELIRAVFLRNGFTVKEGQTDLKPYVYAAAEELLSVAALKAQPSGVVLPERKHTDWRAGAGHETPNHGWNACLDEVARLNQQPATVPAGCKVVPVEPTPEMFSRYLGRPLMNMDRKPFEAWAAEYRAMIASAILEAKR